MTDLRCLSLHQPWASLVAAGVKSIETRSWPTKHRGRIGIASTKRKPTQGIIGEYEVYPADPPGKVHPNHDVERPARLYRNTGGWQVVGGWWPLPLGAIVATANLADCVPIVAGFAGINEPCVSVGEGDTLWLRAKDVNAGSWTRIDGYLGQRNELPYGDYRPGRWAWLLDDVKPTTERCSACASLGFVYEDPPGSTCLGVCPTCDGKGVCDPVPVKGRQGLWRWTP